MPRSDRSIYFSIPVISQRGMGLPHELLDEILSYLPSDSKQDQQSLRNYSLVSKSWTNPSRRHLFKTVEIREETLQSWLDSIPPANCELLQHIRSLSYIATIGTWQSSWQPEHRIDVLREYLPSLHRLQHLSLSSMHIPSEISQQVEIFSTFQHTLSRLSLERCNITTSALVTLINCFSNLGHLDLSYLLHEVDDKTTSPLSCPLIRKLHLSGFREDNLSILNQLSELGLMVDELIVDCQPLGHLPTASHIVNTLGLGIKCLRLSRTSIFCMYTRQSQL